MKEINFPGCNHQGKLSEPPFPRPWKCTALSLLPFPDSLRIIKQIFLIQLRWQLSEQEPDGGEMRAFLAPLQSVTINNVHFLWGLCKYNQLLFMLHKKYTFVNGSLPMCTFETQNLISTDFSEQGQAEWV